MATAELTTIDPARPNLTAAGRRMEALVLAAQAGDRDAWESVMTGNGGMVKHAAFRVYRPGSPLALDDLTQEGYLVIARCIGEFDPARGGWGALLGQSLFRHFRTCVPAAAGFGMGHGTYWRAAYLRAFERPAGGETERRAMNALLPAALTESLGACLVDPREDEPPDVAAHRAARAARLRAALAALAERDRAVITLRFGLEGGPPLTLEAIGARLGVTKERVRQLVASALAKLRLALPAPEAA